MGKGHSAGQALSACPLIVVRIFRFCGLLALLFEEQQSRTAAGRSLTFQWAILFGYVCGITHKILYSNDIVLYLYILNFVMVSIDTGLYFRNRRLDREREKAAGEAA